MFKCFLVVVLLINSEVLLVIKNKDEIATEAHLLYIGRTLYAEVCI